jgi:DNA-binding transcriptional LysR family regulator
MNMGFEGRYLSGIGVLAAVVESGSFVRAGEALGLTQPGVSRAIARLEERIGVRLLDRTTRSVSLTAEGRKLYEAVMPLLTEVDEAVNLASGSAAVVRGRLRVNSDPFFSRLMLAPQIGSFLEKYPEVSLELITREQLGDMVSDGFDVAIRFGEPPNSSLVAKKLLETRILTVASPGYLKKKGRPSRPEEIQQHLSIDFRNPRTGQAFEWEFRRGKKVVQVKTNARLLLSDVDSMLGACLAGVGIAQVMAIDVQKYIEQGRLVDLFPDWPDERFPLYALYPSRHLPAAKLRAFMDFLAEILPVEFSKRGGAK